MGYKSVYREVMRDYESLREQAQELLDQRRGVLYAKAPRVKEIENEVKAIGLTLVKLALAGDEKGIEKARNQVAALELEKKNAIAAAGIGEDYLAAVYQCNECEDTGYKAVAAGQIAERCSCLKQRLIEAYYSLSNIKGVLQDENFDTFDYRCFNPAVNEAEGLSPLVNMQAVYRIATNFVQDFDTSFNNLLLYGRTGLGKTFVCHCIAKDLLDAGHTVLYLTAPRLFKVIEDYRFNRDAQAVPDEMLDAVTDVDLLILDDLGAEFVTVVTSSALFDIINQRLLAKKSTVISTNLSPTELERSYSERIASRFTGYYRMIKFFGDDVRVRSKYGGRYEISPK
ncbi:MAG: ATP-binding protein [Defluviitaleaceae bacterium]|nr:ATP-binding protein [Defluviitaleaceae bacterium]